MSKANETMQAVAERLIASIEEGLVTGEWQKPWSGGGIAMNAVTGNQYSGANLVALWIYGEEFGSQQYATYKQWQSVGAQVRKGESGIRLIKWIEKKCDHPSDVSCENCGRMFPSVFTVFNSTQVDGWDYEAVNVDKQNLDLDHFFASTGANITQVAGGRAAYNKRTDAITVPAFGQFADADSFYATLGHEMVHWTGHSSRLNREFGEKFGDDAYAYEELIAELGSAMLCATLGISDTPRDDHAQYLKHWVGILKNDYRMLWKAASAAQKAVKHIEKQAEVRESFVEVIWGALV